MGENRGIKEKRWEIKSVKRENMTGISSKLIIRILPPNHSTQEGVLLVRCTVLFNRQFCESDSFLLG